MIARVCSECGASLTGRPPQTKTCSDNCRSRRSRRIRRANTQVEEFAEANNAGAAEIAAIVRREAPDVVTRVMKDQLQPIVREALTEDVLQAISNLVGLTPRAVAALDADLDSEDATIRQRAYTLLIKYTVGHPSLVKPSDAEAGSQLVVNFNLPRPAEDETTDQIEHVTELQVCDMCHEEKDASEFVTGSARCQPCFDEWRAKVLAEFS